MMCLLKCTVMVVRWTPRNLTGVARFPQVRLAKGILCAGLHLYFNAYFPVHALESAWFPRMSFLQW